MNDAAEFKPFPKIPRWSNQNMVLTEKLDGTNAQIVINDECSDLRVGSRNRWINPDDDNFGFASWCAEHKEALLTLGKGQHFGEWWGHGIQRDYNVKEKRFSLFNLLRWHADEQREKLAELRAKGVYVDVVPLLYHGPVDPVEIDFQLKQLEDKGSAAAPGFMNPEGLVIYLPGSRSLFKYTIGGNNPKSPKYTGTV